MNTGSEDRVLVVEEPDGRETLKLGLEMAGYRVDLADDGEAGLLVAAARTPVCGVRVTHGPKQAPLAVGNGMCLRALRCAGLPALSNGLGESRAGAGAQEIETYDQADA